MIIESAVTCKIDARAVRSVLRRLPSDGSINVSGYSPKKRRSLSFIQIRAPNIALITT
jgi:hypothetical protein